MLKINDDLFNYYNRKGFIIVIFVNNTQLPYSKINLSNNNYFTDIYKKIDKVFNQKIDKILYEKIRENGFKTQLIKVDSTYHNRIIIMPTKWQYNDINGDVNLFQESCERLIKLTRNLLTTKVVLPELNFKNIGLKQDIIDLIIKDKFNDKYWMIEN